MANLRMGGGFQDIPPVVKNLLIINVLVWVAQLTFKNTGFDDTLALHYAGNREAFGIWQLVTYMFLHSTQSFFHILFNMFGLWMFGSTLENIWGPRRFLLFYLICGVAAGLIQLLALHVDMIMLENKLASGAISEAQFQVLGGRVYWTSTVGASGAIMGIFAAFAYLFPNTPLMIMFLPIPIKAKYVMMGLIALDVIGGFNPGSGIAHFAHIGGAGIGLLLVWIMNKNNRRTFY